MNLADFLPTLGGYYTCSGSLTTAPCSEIVAWLVMKTTVLASAQQLERLCSILLVTYRLAQKLNRRKTEQFN